MTPVTAPISPVPVLVSTPSAAAQKPVSKADGSVHSVKQQVLTTVLATGVLPSEPVALRVEATVATGSLHPAKTHPGLHDWRALERRALSLRLRGPHGI